MNQNRFKKILNLLIKKNIKNSIYYQKIKIIKNYRFSTILRLYKNMKSNFFFQTLRIIEIFLIFFF